MTANNVIVRPKPSRSAMSHPRSGEGTCGMNNKTHRWLSIPKQSPIDFGKPFMLFDLTGPALASQPRRLVLVKQPHDNVLASSGIEANGAVSSLYTMAVIRCQQKHHQTPTANKHDAIIPSYDTGEQWKPESSWPKSMSPTRKQIPSRNRDIENKRQFKNTSLTERSWASP
jgi:hypothetical protein